MTAITRTVPVPERKQTDTVEHTVERVTGGGPSETIARTFDVPLPGRTYQPVTNTVERVS